MKKIISVIAAAAITASCTAAVGAADRVSFINEALQADEIHILYNDKVVEYQDVKPINTDGRVMIPFRAALENMGASVDYDDATRTVTAVKGDTEITFKLLDDTIYIDNNGEKSEITMDVPMIIENDSTYVPIRFMSNALGMQVGWDGDSETVIIMDYGDYMAQIKEIMPNTMRFAELSSKSYGKGSVVFDISGESGVEKASANVSADFTAKDGKEAVSGVVSFDMNGMSLEDGSVSALFDGKKIYVKTDALSKLKMPKLSVQKLILSSAIDSDKWYTIDLEQLGISTEMLEMAMAIANGQMPDAESMLSSYMPEGDVTFNTAAGIAAMLDMYEIIDDNMVVTDNNGKGCTMHLELNSGTIQPASFIQGIDFEIKLDAEDDGETCKTDAHFTVAAGDSKVTFNIAASEQAAGEDDTVEIPASSVDVTSLLLPFIQIPSASYFIPQV